ncbi:DUF2207 domain-containing protein [Chloroflexi bacterium TSY]|nr:DUF2207 domain-containing protein [Chloroflexi bacterium TSY]
MNRSYFIISLLLLILSFLATFTYAQDVPAITYLRYDTEITITRNGDLIVREIQELEFGGEFSQAFAEIPTDFTTRIDEVRILEVIDGQEVVYEFEKDDPQPNTFYAERDSKQIFIEWHYTPTTPGDVRTFILEYQVVGGIWVYREENLLEWRVVPADRSGIPVLASQVTVTLPEQVADEDLYITAFGPEFATEHLVSKEEVTQVRFTAQEMIPDGVRFQIIVGFPPEVTTAETQLWQERHDNAALEYRFVAIDTTLSIEQDGTVWVDELHHVAVDAGALSAGSRQLALRYLDSIDQVSLHEGEQAFTESLNECDYCFELEAQEAGEWVYYDKNLREVVLDEWRTGSIALNWIVPPLVQGEETTFHLRYRVQGAIQVQEDGQRLNWTAVFAEHNAPVETASLRLRLDPSINTNGVKVWGGDFKLGESERIRSQREPDGSWQVTRNDVIPAYEEWVVQVVLPSNATSATAPVWQQKLENVMQEGQRVEAQRTRQQLGFGVASILILAVGFVGLYLIWFVWGRDVPVQMVADYLPEPPSNLPPAIVAYLLDEEPSTQGALASIFQLATQGLYQIEMDEQVMITRLYEDELKVDEELTLEDGDRVRISPYQARLFNVLRPILPLDEKTPLTKIYRRFAELLPTIYELMGQEANAYFNGLPNQTRHRWLVTAQWIIILGAIGGLLAWFASFEFTGLIALGPALAAVIVGAAGTFVSRWMPQRTSAGAQEAARWEPFKEYLANLNRYASQADAQKILDRYFAYAIALGVEKVVLSHAEDMETHVPKWTVRPVHRRSWSRPISESPQLDSKPRPERTSASPRPSSSHIEKGSGDERPRPSLSGMSKGFGAALTSANRSLGSMLTTAISNKAPTTPFRIIEAGTRGAATTTLQVIGAVLEASADSGGGGGGYSSGGSSSRSSSRSSSPSRRSSSSSFGRSSSNRRSGGGGRRGFG